MSQIKCNYTVDLILIFTSSIYGREYFKIKCMC